MAGRLIVLEGIDGTGKASQTALLEKRLRDAGKTVSVYSYPDYDSVYGKRIKAFLYNEIKLSIEELFFLYFIDIIKDNREVKEKLARGEFVLMDRYVFSTVAYQAAGGFDIEKSKSIVSLSGINKPDLVLYIDMPEDISMSRKYKQKESSSVDKFEKNRKFLLSVKKNYNTLLEENFYSDRWARIDAGDDTIDSVFKMILKKIEDAKIL
ncbi:dTMP kinase [Candidatus Parvarchaeota archaeon]|nr:dTMP kinase [Candidatus Parvarchaeota archaeon]